MIIELPLTPRFRLVHEPLRPGEQSWLALGEQRVGAGLAERMRYSDGGSLLVTGFRGVGKTTAVREALRICQETSGDQIVAVELSLARAPGRDQLIFEMVRRLYEALAQSRVLSRMTADMQDVISLAYARTSLSMKQTQSQADERSRQLAVGGTVTVGHGLGTVAIPAPTLNFGRKRSRGLATELSFLTYSDADAEHDLHRILASLRDPTAERRNWWYRGWSKLGLARANQPLRARVVIVLDEIDKLTEKDGGIEAFEILLGSLKNVLGSAGVHFVIVGGVDLHDAWVRDIAGPNSLYRSVFSWHAYTPCVWGQASELLHRIVDPAPESPATDLVAAYLEFTARGILRTLMFELNGLTSWVDGQPHLVVSEGEVDRISLMAELQAWLTELLSETQYSHLLASPIDADRIRLATYYAVDWVLRSAGAQFTADDLMLPGSIDPVLRPSKHIIQRLLDLMEEKGFLGALDPSSPEISRAALSPDPSVGEKRYWLSVAAQDRLQLVARGSGRGRVQVRDTISPETELAGPSRGALEQLPADVRDALAPRYELERILAVGGLGSVWSARSATGDELAIKIISSHRGIHSDPQLITVAHPNVVTTREVIETEHAVAQVMDLVDGRALASLSLPLPTTVGVRIFDRLLDALEYLHHEGWCRLDLKPANIVMRHVDDPVIVDLGTAIKQRQAGAQGPGSFVGTVAFSAPEAWGGTFDIRSDLYSLAVAMAEIFGSPPHYDGGTFDPDRLRPTVDRLPLSPDLRDLLKRGMAPNADDRYADPSAMRHALHRTPEWQQASRESP